MTTLEELEKRVSALEENRPPDIRRAVGKIGEILEETRLRVSAVERNLEEMRRAMFEAVAESARRHGVLEAKIDAARAELKGDIASVRTELNAEVASLRRDLPGIVADSVREVLKEQRRT